MKTSACLSRWIRGAALSAAALVLLPACTTVQLTDDTIGQFKLGELQTVVEGDFAATYDAAKAALADQGLFLTGDDRKVIEAVLTARDRTDTAATVKIKEVSPGQTSVRIRYGLTGDAARSQNLFRAIEERL